MKILTMLFLYSFLNVAVAYEMDPLGVYITPTKKSITDFLSPTINSDPRLLPDSLGVEGVDGFVVVLHWNEIAPTRDTYDWTVLDKLMELAVLKGKKVQIGIIGGNDQPTWLSFPDSANLPEAERGLGLTPIEFEFAGHQGEKGACRKVTMVPPWNDLLLEEFDLLIKTLSARLKTQGTYDTVSKIRLSGIMNIFTEETRLPYQDATTPGECGKLKDSVLLWKAAGYSPTKLEGAWTKMINSYKTHFPDKKFDMAIVPGLAFPRMESPEFGVINSNSMTERLVVISRNLLPNQFILQYSFLLIDQPVNEFVVSMSTKHQVPLGFETNQWGGYQGGAVCLGPVTTPTYCKNDIEFYKLLSKGIFPYPSSSESSNLKSKYLEVFPMDALKYQGAILKAHGTIMDASQLRVPNQAPTLDVDTDIEIQLPTNEVILGAVASDTDGMVRSAKVSQISGGPATIVDPANINTKISGLQAGLSEFMISVKDDDGMETSAVIKVTVLFQLVADRDFMTNLKALSVSKLFNAIVDQPSDDFYVGSFMVTTELKLQLSRTMTIARIEIYDGHGGNVSSPILLSKRLGADLNAIGSAPTKGYYPSNPASLSIFENPGVSDEIILQIPAGVKINEIKVIGF